MIDTKWLKIYEREAMRALKEYGEFQAKLIALTELTPEQLIEKLKQGWQLTPPNRDELDALFEGMAKLGTAKANIHPEGKGEYIKRLADDKGISLRELAKLSGILEDAIHMIVKRNPATISFPIAVKLATALHEPLENFTEVEPVFERNSCQANIHPDGDEHILACPRCGSGEYLHNEDGNRNDYCGQCGQKIEWGEEDES